MSFSHNNKLSSKKHAEHQLAHIPVKSFPSVGCIRYLRYWEKEDQFVFLKCHLNDVETLFFDIQDHFVNPYRPKQSKLLKCSENRFAFIRETTKVKKNNLNFDKKFHYEAMELYISHINSTLYAQLSKTERSKVELKIENLKKDTRIVITEDTDLSNTLTQAQSSLRAPKPIPHKKKRAAGDMKSQSSHENDSDVAMASAEPETHSHTTLQNSNASSCSTPLSNSPRISATAGSPPPDTHISQKTTEHTTLNAYQAPNTLLLAADTVMAAEESLPPPTSLSSSSSDQKQDSYTQISKMITSTASQNPSQVSVDRDVEMKVVEENLPVQKSSSTSSDDQRLNAYMHTLWTGKPNPMFSAHQHQNKTLDTLNRVLSGYQAYRHSSGSR